MAVVKIKEKKELDELVANLTLRLGKKISQQDVLDACIKLSTIHITELETISPLFLRSRTRELERFWIWQRILSILPKGILIQIYMV